MHCKDVYGSYRVDSLSIVLQSGRCAVPASAVKGKVALDRASQDIRMRPRRAAG